MLTNRDMTRSTLRSVSVKDDARMNPYTNGHMNEGHASAKDSRAAWCLLG